MRDTHYGYGNTYLYHRIKVHVLHYYGMIWMTNVTNEKTKKRFVSSWKNLKINKCPWVKWQQKVEYEIRRMENRSMKLENERLRPVRCGGTPQLITDTKLIFKPNKPEIFKKTRKVPWKPSTLIPAEYALPLGFQPIVQDLWQISDSAHLFWVTALGVFDESGGNWSWCIRHR